MLRWLASLLVLALLVGGWLFLREAPERTLAGAPTVRADDATIPAPGGPRERSSSALERTSLDPEPAQDPAANVEELAEPATAVLAGRLVIDGGPLREAARLTLNADAAVRGMAGAEGSFETDALGRFRREGLPAQWSGSLRLHAPYRRAGDAQGSPMHLALDGPSETLEIAVARDACLRGRLRHARAELVAEANLDVRLYASSGGYTQLSASTDGAGRFFVVLRDASFPKVLVEAIARDGATCSVARERSALAFDPATGDYDLGDLWLLGGFEAHVRVLGPDRAPIADAQVLVSGASLRAPARTDAAGETRFAVPDTATDLRVVVPGYALESFPVPTDGERVDLVLRRTNRLRIEVLDDRGQPWAGGRVRLRSEGELYASGQSSLPGALVRGKQSFDGSGNVDELGRYHVFVVPEDGAIETQDLTPGTPLTAQAIDELQGTWVEARIEGLAEQESRTVRLQLPEAGPRVRGRCTDRAGHAVDNALVWFERSDVSTPVRCDEDGAFVAPPLVEGPMTVRATAPGYAMTDSVAVDPHGPEVRLVLEPGRTLRVAVVDGRGEPVRTGQLRLVVPGTSRVWSRGRQVGADHVFSDVAAEALELEFEWFSRRVTQRVGPEQEHVSLTVETLGTLQIAVDGSIPEPEEWLNLRLTALDGPAPGAELVTYAPTLSGSETVEHERELMLWPGVYEVQLLEFRFDDRRRPLPSVPYLHAVRVEVRAGETSRVTLGDPARDD